METSSSKSQIVGLVVSFLIGLALIFYSVDLSIHAVKTKKWPTTIGTIISSEVKSESNRRGERYIPKICYSYKVGTEQYSSDKISSIFIASRNNSTRAEQVVKKYPVNSNVTVYYNPNELKDSVLEPGIKFGNFSPLLIGLAFFLPTIIVYSYSHKKRS